MITERPLAKRDGARQGDARPAAPSDWLRLSWLIETSRRVYTRWGGESLRALLAEPGAVIWHQGRALRGAVLLDPRGGAVAEARLLVVHDDADRSVFAAEALSLAESRLARRGTRWVSFTSPEGWLRELLAARGYVLKDRVITYVRRGLDLRARGNTDVAVEEALPEDVPGMVAVDAAAFEPFWRLEREAMRRALDEEAYVLVARGSVRAGPRAGPGGAWEQAPLPNPPPGYGERAKSSRAYARDLDSLGALPHDSVAPLPEYREGERGAVVGYLTADVWEERAHVVRLAVVPEWQGRGVATRLMADLFRRLGANVPPSRRSDGDLREEVVEAAVREVSLNTQETNLRSRRLYEALGFRLTGGVEEVWAREVAPAAAAV